MIRIICFLPHPSSSYSFRYQLFFLITWMEKKKEKERKKKYLKKRWLRLKRVKRRNWRRKRSFSYTERERERESWLKETKSRIRKESFCVRTDRIVVVVLWIDSKNSSKKVNRVTEGKTNHTRHLLPSSSLLPSTLSLAPFFSPTILSLALPSPLDSVNRSKKRNVDRWIRILFLDHFLQ